MVLFELATDSDDHGKNNHCRCRYTTIIVFYSIVLENHLANKWRKLDDYRNGVGFYQLLSLPEIKENVETVHLMRSQSFVCYATGPIMPRVKLRMMRLEIIALIATTWAWRVIGSAGDNVNYLKMGSINLRYTYYNNHSYSQGKYSSLVKSANRFSKLQVHFVRRKITFESVRANQALHCLHPTIRKTLDRKIWVRTQKTSKEVVLQTLIMENIWKLWANFLSIKVLLMVNT